MRLFRSGVGRGRRVRMPRPGQPITSFLLPGPLTRTRSFPPLIHEFMLLAVTMSSNYRQSVGTRFNEQSASLRHFELLNFDSSSATSTRVSLHIRLLLLLLLLPSLSLCTPICERCFTSEFARSTLLSHLRLFTPGILHSGIYAFTDSKRALCSV